MFPVNVSSILQLLILFSVMTRVATLTCQITHYFMSHRGGGMLELQLALLGKTTLIW